MGTFEELMQLISDIPANYHEETFRMLYKYIPTLPEGEFLEFGTGLAKATCMIALCNPKLKITTFDTAIPYNYPDYNEQIKQTLEKHGITENVNHFIANSLEYETDLEFVGMNIDSGHSYELTLAELKRWMPKVKKGGIVFNDDYLDNRVKVKKELDEYLIEHESEWEVLNNGMCLVMQKV